MRASDRWITPRVIVAAMFLGTVILLAVVAAVTFLTYLGLDPDPMIRLVANVTAAVGSLGTFAVQLTTRRTTTDVQRKVGKLEPVVVEALEELDARSGRHAPTRSLPPVPTRPHPFGNGNGPRPAGESGADQGARTREDNGGRSEWPGGVR